MTAALLVLLTGISYANPGASADKVVADLAQIMGRKLEAAKAMSKDILVVRLHAADPDDVLAQVAWAVGGSWEQDGETLRLVRTGQDLAAERRREAEIIRKDLASWRQQSLEQVKGQDGESWARRGLLEFLEYFPMRELEKLPTDVPAVFSDQPTQLQFALPAPTLKAVAILRADYEKMRSQPTPKSDPDSEPEFEAAPGFDPTPGPWGKMLLTFNRAPEVPGFLLATLIFLDRSGSARGSFSVKSEVAEDLELTESYFKDVDPWEKVRAHWRELRPKLRYPTRFEPLSLSGGPVFRRWAEKKGLNLIANLHDSMVAEPWTGDLSEKMIRGTIEPTNEFVEDSVWIKFRPKAAAYSRETRVDRTLLERYASEISQDEDLPLRRACQWKMAFPRDSALVSYLEMSLHDSPSGGFYGTEGIYRLIGSFSDAQMKAAYSDGIGFADLSGAQQVAFRQYLLNSSGDFELKPSVAASRVTTFLDMEPTEFLAGRLNQPRLVIQEIQKPTYLPKSKGEELALDEKGFARLKLSAQDPTRPKTDYDFGFARPATLTGWTVTVDVSQAFEIVSEASATTGIGAMTPYEKLPDAFRNQVEAEMRVIMEKRKNRKATPPTHAVPPPR